MPPFRTSHSTSSPRIERDFEFDAAVGQKHACAGLDFTRKAGKVGGDQLRGPCHLARRDGQHGPRLQEHGLSILQAAGTNLWALQVLKNADGALQMAGGAAQALDSPGVFGVGSVGEIQAGNVHARAHQVANHCFGITGGTDGADDFCAAQRVPVFSGSRAGAGRSPSTRSGLLFFQIANPFHRTAESRRSCVEPGRYAEPEARLNRVSTVSVSALRMSCAAEAALS